MRKITFVCAIAMLVAFALPAQAAVQNVKVSGDITIRGIYRESMDLNANDTLDEDQFLMSTVGVNIDADLTDNVSAAIRVGSQRDWDVAGIASTDVDIDLAYITLKEMLYSPLTIVVGRQDLWYGDGFIVGANFTNPDPGDVISAHEYTDVTSFDALRAILDYDPWTIDLLYAKLDENTTGAPDDIDLWGVNVGYVFSEYDAEAEAYLFTKHDSSLATEDGDYVYTIGVRGSFVPVENLDLRGELAFQCGDYIDPTLGKRDREAWAVDVSGSYCWADYAWLPSLGVGYIYLSGEEAGNTGDFEAWDSMYTGKIVSALRDFHEWMYGTDQFAADILAGNLVAADVNRIHGLTSAHKIIVNGNVQPTDNVLLEATYLHLIFAEAPVADRDEEIGDEVNLRLTYEYTEDVTFGLLAAWFFPGDYFIAADGNDTATEVVGTVSLVF